MRRKLHGIVECAHSALITYTYLQRHTSHFRTRYIILLGKTRGATRNTWILSSDGHNYPRETSLAIRRCEPTQLAQSLAMVPSSILLFMDKLIISVQVCIWKIPSLSLFPRMGMYRVSFSSVVHRSQFSFLFSVCVLRFLHCIFFFSDCSELALCIFFLLILYEREVFFLLVDTCLESLNLLFIVMLLYFLLYKKKDKTNLIYDTDRYVLEWDTWYK